MERARARATWGCALRRPRSSSVLWWLCRLDPAGRRRHSRTTRLFGWLLKWTWSGRLEGRLRAGSAPRGRRSRKSTLTFALCRENSPSADLVAPSEIGCALRGRSRGLQLQKGAVGDPARRGRVRSGQADGSPSTTDAHRARLDAGGVDEGTHERLEALGRLVDLPVDDIVRTLSYAKFEVLMQLDLRGRAARARERVRTRLVAVGDEPDEQRPVAAVTVEIGARDMLTECVVGVARQRGSPAETRRLDCQSVTTTQQHNPTTHSRSRGAGTSPRYLGMRAAATFVRRAAEVGLVRPAGRPAPARIGPERPPLAEIDPHIRPVPRELALGRPVHPPKSDAF